MNRLSIRTRITLGSLAVAALLLLAALVLVRAQVASVLTAADVTLAESDLTSFQQDITANPDETVDDPGTGVLVYVRNPDGEVQVNTLPHDVLAVIADRPSRDEQFSFTDDEGRAFVIVGRTVDTRSGSWSLWSARSTSSSSLALQGLDGVLVVGGLVLLAGFGIASWLLATAALRPVAAMRRQAEELGADGQLPVPRAHDELADLATTINRFLAQVQSASGREKRMVSDAAHELRTPLAALKTQLELAHRDEGDAAALLQHVRAAESAVERLSSLASNLLELSRLESQESRSVSQASALLDEFMGSIDRARTLALSNEVTVDFDAGILDEQALYRIDRQAFGRLTDNLLSNSVNALAAGGTVAAVISQADGHLILTVSDDGPGVPDDFLPIAFERFTRPDASRTTTTGGSGLGLALVQALVREAGGEATLRNTHPGLTVEVTLPNV